jgi:hypothetical protein
MTYLVFLLPKYRLQINMGLKKVDAVSQRDTTTDSIQTPAILAAATTITTPSVSLVLDGEGKASNS